MRHNWTEDGKDYFVTEQGIGGPLPSLDEVPAALPDYVDALHRSRTQAAANREILRLAEENRALKLEKRTRFGVEVKKLLASDAALLVQELADYHPAAFEHGVAARIAVLDEESRILFDLAEGRRQRAEALEAEVERLRVPNRQPLETSAWEAVYGGGSRCSDGWPHVPSTPAPDGSAVCQRCDAVLRRVEEERICVCAHAFAEHRGGGLCEACMPPSDSTGARSECQMFRARHSQPTVPR
jgi:hypothetical protein